MTDSVAVPPPNRMMTDTDLAHWGMHGVAYVKRGLLNDEPGWTIHAADGTKIGAASDREVAFVSIRQHDMEPVSTH